MNRLLALAIFCCFVTGILFANEPDKEKMYTSKEYRFGIERHQKDFTLQIVRKGAEYQMIIYAPKGRSLKIIKTKDSYDNMNYMQCLEHKYFKKEGIEYNLMVFSVPAAYDNENYYWTDMEIDGQIVPVSVARKMRKQMQKGFHVVDMRYNHDRAKLSSKIKIEEGWHSNDSRFSFVPGRTFYSE